MVFLIIDLYANWQQGVCLSWYEGVAARRQTSTRPAQPNTTQRRLQQQKRRLKYGVARRLSAIPAFLYAAAFSVAFPHFRYDFGAYFTHKHAFVPTVEIVE